MDLSELCETWMQAKQAEAMATETRRKIEDQMASLIGLPEIMDTTENIELESGFKIKIVGRLNRKVDSDKIQEIAAENGLENHLSTLIRWKPEVNMAAWRAADENIIRAFSDAITTTAGRPSFSIVLEK